MNVYSYVQVMCMGCECSECYHSGKMVKKEEGQ